MGACNAQHCSLKLSIQEATYRHQSRTRLSKRREDSSYVRPYGDRSLFVRSCHELSMGMPRAGDNTNAKKTTVVTSQKRESMQWLTLRLSLKLSPVSPSGRSICTTDHLQNRQRKTERQDSKQRGSNRSRSWNRQHWNKGINHTLVASCTLEQESSKPPSPTRIPRKIDQPRLLTCSYAISDSPASRNNEEHLPAYIPISTFCLEESGSFKNHFGH